MFLRTLILILPWAIPLQGVSQRASEVVDGVRSAEQSLRNIKIVARYVRNEKLNGGELEYRGEGKATIWYSQVPLAMARFEAEPLISPWNNGRADFAEEHLGVSFNGRISIVLRRKSGALGDIRVINRSAVMPGRTNYVDVLANSFGWSYTLYGVHQQTGRLLSEILETEEGVSVDLVSSADPKIWQITLTTATGGDESGSEPGVPTTMTTTWWLDQDHNWGIVRGEAKVGSELFSSVEAVGWKDAAPGVSYPTKLVIRNYGARGEVTSRLEVECESAEANTELSDEIFLIDLPAGYRVEDQILGSFFEMAHDKTELSTTIDSQIATIQSAKSPPPVDAGPRGPWVQLAIVGVVTLSVSLLLWLAVIRRKNVSRTVMGGVLIVALAGGEVRAQHPSIMSELRDEKVYNCSLNSALLVGRWFGLSVEVEDAANALGCGPYWERAVDMATLQSYLRGRGLNVVPYAEATLKDIASWITRKHGLVIIHLEPRREVSGGAVGHYVIACKADGRSILVADAGRGMKWIDYEENHIAGQSGYVLMVNQTDIPGELFDLSSVRTVPISLPTMTAGSGQVSTQLRVVNGSGTELRLVESKSSCSCFAGGSFVSGGSSLGPGEQDILQLMFSKSKLPLGASQREVMLALDHGGNRQQVLLTVDVLVERPTAAGGGTLTWIPETIDLRSAKEGSEHLKVFYPSAVAPVRAYTTDVRLSLEGPVTEFWDDRSSGGSHRIETYTVRYYATKPAVNGKDESGETIIVIETTDEGMPRIEVPVVLPRRN